MNNDEPKLSTNVSVFVPTYGEEIQKTIKSNPNIWAMFPKLDRNYKEEWGFEDTSFGIIEVWLNPRPHDIDIDVIRKNRKYISSDIRQFFLKNDLSKKSMWNEFLRLMKNYNNDYCACSDYYSSCEPHSLKWWLGKLK